MKRILFAPTFLLLLAFATASAQTKPAPIVASPSQQQSMKPLLDAEKKAVGDYQAVAAKAQAVFDADPAVKKARAVFELAVKTEMAAFETARNRAWDKMYQILAENKLSSREFAPVIEEGELVFRKIEKKDNNEKVSTTKPAPAAKPDK